MGDGFMGKAFAVQAGEPELGSPEPTESQIGSAHL